MVSVKAKESFRFYTRLHLSELTGLKAATIGELLENIKAVPEACIYHHTHRFLQQHQYLSPEPPNDFAYWVAEVLGDGTLGERLASIDIMRFVTIESLRGEIIKILESYIDKNKKAAKKFVLEGEELHFVKAVSFILPTQHVATDLKEFVDILKKITIDSIYFHVFESRLRLGKKTNDFSHWIDTSLGAKEMADAIARLDPYTCTLEDLRKDIVKIIEHKSGGLS